VITLAKEGFAMNRVLCHSFICCLVLIGSPREQDPTPGEQQTGPAAPAYTVEVKNRISRLIKSSSSKDLAWAAYLIGQHELKEFEPALTELLDASPTDEWGWLVRTVVMDSLIRLRINLPPERLMLLYEQFPDEVLIIMAREPEENRDALFSIARNPERSICWVTACNLLEETKAPGFAEFLLRDLETEISLLVTDPGTIGAGSGGGYASSGCGPNMSEVPEDFPPIATYRLTDELSRDGVVIAPGPHPVLYDRDLNEPGIVHRPWSDKSIDWNEYRLEYLALLLERPTTELRLRKSYTHVITWANSKQYASEVIKIRESVIGDFEDLKKRLIDKERLTNSEAEELKPNMILNVIDARKNKTVPLPEIQGFLKRQ
jgi:hypothetical protein